MQTNNSDLDRIAQKGFKNELEMNQLITAVDLRSPDKLKAYQDWSKHDGTKAGVVKLLPKDQSCAQFQVEPSRIYDLQAAAHDFFMQDLAREMQLDNHSGKLTVSGWFPTAAIAYFAEVNQCQIVYPKIAA